jgi:hypothetical protein
MAVTTATATATQHWRHVCSRSYGGGNSSSYGGGGGNNGNLSFLI